MNSVGSQMGVAVGVSKVLVPFIPYLSLTYRQQVVESQEQHTTFEITLGTAIAWSKDGAVFIEYSSTNVTPNKDWDPLASDYTMGQFAAGVGFHL